MAMLRVRRGGFVLLVSLLLAACSGSSGTNADGDPTASPEPAPEAGSLLVSGSVGDGPVVGADLVVTDANDQVLEEITSDDLAGYELSLPSDAALPVLVTATGGTDLVTFRELDFALVGAVLDTGIVTVNISPLTTLAVRAAQCMDGGMTGNNLTAAWERVHAELGMGLDSARIADPMGEPVTAVNIEAVVLANEALGEAVRRTEQALAGTGKGVDGDAVVGQLACALVGVTGPAVEPRVITTFKAAELAVRLETLAGRLEVDGWSAVGRMNDAIRTVEPGFPAPSVADVPVTAQAVADAVALLSLFQATAASDALVRLAGDLASADPATVAGRVDAALTAALHGDLAALATNLALADDTAIADLEARRTRQDTATAPIVSLAANPAEVDEYGSTSLSWATSGADRCVASGGWQGAVSLEGVHATGAMSESASFALSCAGLGGATTRSVDVLVAGAPVPDPAPALSLSAADSVVAYGGYSRLSWHASDADSCSAGGAWGGSKAASGAQTVGPLDAAATYRLTCTGPGGSVTRSVAVDVEAPTQPTLTFSADETTFTSGGNTWLRWSAGNAGTCTAGGDWSGDKGVSGSQWMGSIDAAVTYRLTCDGAGGSVTRSVSVEVEAPVSDPEPEPAPAPTVSLSADASVVDSGGSALLSWNAEHADTCAASAGWGGSKAISGSQSVGPLDQQTSFTLTCSGGDNQHAATTITVLVNGSVALSWEAPTENVDGTTLDDLAGFKIYYGVRSGEYTETLGVDAPSTTSRELTLTSGVYYFAMTALDTSGNESLHSNEVVKTVN